MDFSLVKHKIKDTVDIVDIISQYTSLEQAGDKMKGLSPFTNEKTPSFFVNPVEGVYYCFSSQKGGDVFTFIQEMEGVNFMESLKILAEHAGIDISDSSSEPDKNFLLYDVLESATNYYQKELNKEIRDHLHSRGISDESIEKWRLGFAPDRWNSICAPSVKGKEEYSISGLCIDKGKGLYDRFRGRIMFPFFNVQNKTIAFSGRAYKKDDGAKYINSPETPLFNKSTFLYGLNLAKGNIRKSNFSIITEGPIDSIMVHQAGYPVSVAVSGTAVTREHLVQLQRLSNRILIAFDGDSAGVRATIRVISISLSLGMDVKVIKLSDGEDPADVVLKDVERFKTLVKNAPGAIEFLLGKISERYSNPEDILRAVKEEVLPVIANIKDELIKDYAKTEVSKICSISKESVNESLSDHKVIENIDAGKKKFERPVVSKGINEKMDSLLSLVSYGYNFLLSNNEEIPKEIKKNIEEIQKFEHLLETNEKVVEMMFSEAFKDEDNRREMIIDELKTNAYRLVLMIRKKEEVKKISDSMEKEK